MESIRIIGLDPSLVACGWGVVEAEGLKIRHLAHGVIKPNTKMDLHLRLRELFETITDVIQLHDPSEAAVEEAFMKNNAASAIKLGHARGRRDGHSRQSPSRPYDECPHAGLWRQSGRRSRRPRHCHMPCA